MTEQIPYSLPINARVRLTPEAFRTFPKKAHHTGTVARYARRHGMVFVQWDGRRTADGPWAEELLTRLDIPSQPAVTLYNEIAAEIARASEITSGAAAEYSLGNIREIIDAALAEGGETERPVEGCFECGTPLVGPICPKCNPTVSPDIAAKLLEAVEEIMRTPSKPFPDPGAHLWKAFASNVHMAWHRIQQIAREARDAAIAAGVREEGE